MRIIKNRQRTTHTSYSLVFDLLNPTPDLKGCGYSFPCDKDGNVDVDKLPPSAKKSWDICQSGQDTRMSGMQYRWQPMEGHVDGGDYRPVLCTGEWKTFNLSKGEVHTYSHVETDPAVGECNHCGHEVTLYGFTNTCSHCHTDYNMSGQELAPRSQWGEETGESVSDILAADSLYVGDYEEE